MKKGERTRQAILDDALAQASVLGLEALTIGALAKRTGMSKSGLFAHFESKEGLQIAILDEAGDRFVTRVVAPALRQPRGAPRVRALFDGWLAWERADDLPGGCPFIAAAAELDDRIGPVRERLVAVQRDWLDTLEAAARVAVDEGHFRADLDVAQWAFELLGLVLAHHWYARLLGATDAEERVRRGFAALLERAES